MNSPVEKPAGLSPEYAAQFQDSSIVAAYRFRNPYPDEVFAILHELSRQERPLVADLGCGTGDLTLGLARFAAEVDAVDISDTMLAEARRRSTDQANIRWILSPAESAPLSRRYDLITAGESFHWMDWPVVLSRVASWLKPGACFALVNRGYANGSWWTDEFQALITKHSTNKDFKKYDLVEELKRRQLLEVHGHKRTQSQPFRQAIADLIEAFHSRNGFSRDRMSLDQATDFAREASAHLARFADRDGMLELGAVASVTWGTVMARTE